MIRTGREGARREVRRVYHKGAVMWGVVDGDTLRLESGVELPCEQALHLAPVEPAKIICVHLNYDDRRVEFGQPAPEQVPSYFMKPSTSLLGHNGVAYRPRGALLLNYEGEVAVVVGERLRNATQDEAAAAIAGFAPANDIGCHDFRGVDRGSMLRVKGMDGFCAIGPGLVSGVAIDECELSTFVNGERVQHARVGDMMFSPAYMLADLSRYMTLLPGDVLLSGTPMNSRPLNVDDVVEVEVTGIGRLTTKIEDSPVSPLEIGFQADASASSARVALGSDFESRWPAVEAAQREG